MQTRVKKRTTVLPGKKKKKIRGGYKEGVPGKKLYRNHTK